MKRLLSLLMLLLWPAWASAQIVTPGGGAIGGAAGSITGGTCSNPQFVQAINTSGVPTCATPSGVPGSLTPYQTFQTDASNNPLWNTYPAIGEAPPANVALGINMAGIATTGSAVQIVQNNNAVTPQWGLQVNNSHAQGAAGVQLTGGTGATTVTGALVAYSTSNASPWSGAIVLNGGTNVAGVVINAPTGGSVNEEINGVSIANVTSSGLFLSVALAAGQGGTGLASTPASGQILVGQAGAVYALKSVGGDATMTNTGALTVTKSGGTLLTALFAPLSLAGTSSSVGFNFAGTVTANTIAAFTCTVPLTVGTNFASSAATCGTNPAESDAYTVKVNSVSLGTITLSTSCVATLGTATQTTCSAGQRMEIDAPATVSGANVAITLAVTR